MHLRSAAVIMSLLCAPAWGAEDDAATAAPAASAMPIAAQVLIDREAQQEVQAKAQYAAQVAKLHADLAKRLKASQDTATRAGDLDGALAIKAKIAALAAPVASDAAASDSPAGTYQVSDTAWNVTTIELRDQGHFVKASDGSTGTWVLKDGRLTITWYNGNTNTARYTDDRMLMQANGGSTFTIIRH